ncbi:MAG: ribosome small subunit-dependent GTPase A [Gammaproteobacteria bacterium]|nr:ribosome small subunit-dependent GTPase A [Gammaproteobacteria bacterium]
MDQLGTVITKYRKNYAVEADDRTLILCTARHKTAIAICGDRVHWQPSGGGGIITAILPRRSELARPDERGTLRSIAANLDQLIIVNTLRQDCDPATPAFNVNLIDRYLVAAELIGITPLIVVNKVDLVPEALRSRLSASLIEYSTVGYPVITTSTRLPDGLAALQQRLDGHLSALVGESGVGKSSLIRHLLPTLDIRIGDLSEISGLGRHTTSATTLYHLPGGGDLIDSPGVRDFGLWHVAPDELIRGFREFLPLFGECRFRNCRHLGEKGCALEVAAAHGTISQRRLDSYRDILRSLGQR